MSNSSSGIAPVLWAARSTVLVLLSAAVARTEILPPADLSKAEIMQLGERMYRDGILPSGKAMNAYSRGDIDVGSNAFSCSSCHLRAGLGSVEGIVATPPTTGARLYKPYLQPQSPNDTSGRAGRSVYSKTAAQLRPVSCAR